MNPLDEVWARLRAVTALEFVTESRSATGWAGSGSGSVTVSEAAPGVMLCEEAGRWTQAGGRVLRFTNTFRWTRFGDRLRLEHLRLGAENPVFLFDMAPDAGGVWRDVEPHLCRADRYAAELRLEQGVVSLRWSVEGPTRDETIAYSYQ